MVLLLVAHPDHTILSQELFHLCHLGRWKSGRDGRFAFKTKGFTFHHVGIG